MMIPYPPTAADDVLIAALRDHPDPLVRELVARYNPDITNEIEVRDDTINELREALEELQRQLEK